MKLFGKWLKERPIDVGIFVATVIILVVMNTILRTTLLVHYGVRVFRRAQQVCSFILGLEIVSALIFDLPQLVRAIKQQRQKEREEALRRPQELYHEIVKPAQNNDGRSNAVCQRLEKLDIPGLEQTVQQCMNDIDRLYLLRNKQRKLIDENSALYLEDTIAPIDRIEQQMLRNFQKICNLCTVADNFEQVDMEAVQALLDDDDRMLDDVKKLLKVSAAWINNHEADDQQDRSTLQHLINVIDGYLEGEKNEEFTEFD